MIENEIIAEFMGIKTLRYHEGMDDDRYWFHDLEFPFLNPDEMKYHSSWDWLMPVCHKITNLDNKGFNTEGLLGQLRIQNTVMSFELDELYDAVIMFIKWYNENKK